MDAKTLAAAAGIDGALAMKWAEPLTIAMDNFAIVTPKRHAHFIAQIGHESGSFARLVENLNYSAEGLLRTWPSRFDKASASIAARNPERIANIVYGGRMGNVDAGDGWKYRGRGLIQLTGRGNYRRAAYATGLELLVHPELLEHPSEAATVAAWFWADKGLNAFADAGNLETITRRINGGVNGLVDRRERYLRAARALGV